MHKLTLLFSLLVLFTCCSKEPTKTIQHEAEFVVSPFNNLMGTWQLDHQIINGEVTYTDQDILHIEEDDNYSDLEATGYWAQGTPDNKKDIFIQLLSGEHNIKIERGTITYYCNYRLRESDVLEIDDSAEDIQFVSIWKRI